MSSHLDIPTTEESALMQPGMVGAPHTETSIARDFQHQEAIRREASGNALPMSALQSGGAAGVLVPEANAQSNRDNDTTEIETFNAIQRGSASLHSADAYPSR
ncbi:uncharacterized protein SPPG_08925 [Spizellomyces punctatus DAOM BR117]|uniref:Uncharacterized protein n=1 Tax=Spizellomyces punctatus (strain DAOM BR117) TaxID=645134 RepID=A0A0L0HR59_SPIPD|nr:uncharacterized protein SPPG_08925 [Spizellomyces punctatus DAOM BR117]KND03861.1 hypothetical protein SPPG_08925 [Spizellomyces punctatus DAOM BR117]|eukprot:XP_016611900.1 hypothetical protein SPPG_08925 [Spizellomyces punctatus DAOM BR117]